MTYNDKLRKIRDSTAKFDETNQEIGLFFMQNCQKLHRGIIDSDNNFQIMQNLLTLYENKSTIMS